MHILRLAWIALVLGLAASAASGQKLTKKELRKLPYNDARQCPHTQGDPELLAQLGILSTGGGFPFGAADTDAVEELLPTARLLWAETEHFRLGFGLGDYKIPGKDRSRIEAELQEIRVVLPDLNVRMRSLDPWLRLYLTARRLEKLWDRFLDLIQVEETAFPQQPGAYIIGTRFMGIGPYMGMADKHEVLIVASQPQHVAFLTKNFGLPMTHTQRWHVIDRGALTVSIHAQQDGMRIDEALQAHIAFNVGQNLLDGYKHYAYDLPVWLREGVSHALEREVTPNFNSFDGSEGVAPMQSRKSDWDSEVAELIGKNDAPRMSELMRLKAFGDMSLDDHFTTWSMVRFLIDEHPVGFACILDRLTGLLDENGILDGSGMADHHREAFKACLGMTYSQFDEAWRRWATGTEEEEEEEGT